MAMNKTPTFKRKYIFSRKYIYLHLPTWVFPKIGVPQNGWLIMKNPIRMDDLGGTTIFGNIYIFP